MAKIKHGFLPDLNLDEPSPMQTQEGMGMFDVSEEYQHHLPLKPITDEMSEQEKLNA